MHVEYSGIKMFEKVGVPVLGIVQNMAYFECPKCQVCLLEL